MLCVGRNERDLSRERVLAEPHMEGIQHPGAEVWGLKTFGAVFVVYSMSCTCDVKLSLTSVHPQQI